MVFALEGGREKPNPIRQFPTQKIEDGSGVGAGAGL
jgi:hypothetical protein